MRRVVATVGKEGQPGEQVRCLISVAMLSGGWDARNVCKSSGCGPFQSQLLLWALIGGRGLQRHGLHRPVQAGIRRCRTASRSSCFRSPRRAAARSSRLQRPRYVHTMRDRASLKLEVAAGPQIHPDVGDTPSKIAWDDFEAMVVDPPEAATPRRRMSSSRSAPPARGSAASCAGQQVGRRPVPDAEPVLQARRPGRRNQLEKPWLFPAKRYGSHQRLCERKVASSSRRASTSAMRRYRGISSNCEIG